MLKGTLKVILMGLLCLSAYAPASSAENTAARRLTDSKCNNRGPQINDGGVVTWWAFCDGENHVYVMKDGRAVRLTEGGLRGRNPQINAAGDIVWQGSDGERHGIFLYRKDKVIMLDSPVGLNSAPSINDRGVVVWQGVVEGRDESGRPGLHNVIFRYEKGSIKRLDTGTDNSKTPDINNKGAVAYAGWVDKADPATGEVARGYTGVFEVFLLDEKGAKRLSDSPTYNDNRGPRLNERGAVVWTGEGDDRVFNVYLYDGRRVEKLTENKRSAICASINNSGKIVWQGWDGENFQVYLYDGKSIRQLTESGYNNIEPFINNRDEIVWASQRDGNYQIYLMRLGR